MRELERGFFDQALLPFSPQEQGKGSFIPGLAAQHQQVLP
jgi:hypothetical protein